MDFCKLGEKNKGKKEETIVLCLSMLCFNLYSNCAELNGWGEAELPATVYRGGGGGWAELP